MQTNLLKILAFATSATVVVAMVFLLLFMRDMGVYFTFGFIAGFAVFYISHRVSDGYWYDPEKYRGGADSNGSPHAPSPD